MLSMAPWRQYSEAQAWKLGPTQAKFGRQRALGILWKNSSASSHLLAFSCADMTALHSKALTFNLHRQSNVALMPTESRAFLKHVSPPQIQITLLTYRFKLHSGKQMEPTLYVRFSDVFQNCLTHSHQILVCSFHPFLLRTAPTSTSTCTRRSPPLKWLPSAWPAGPAGVWHAEACYARSYKKVPKPPRSERNGGFTHNLNNGFNQPPPNKGLLRLTKGL